MAGEGARRLTVLQVVPALDAGGVEQTAVEIATALVAAGHRAFVAGMPGRLVPALQAAGGEFLPMPLATKNPLAVWLNAGRLARLIESEDVDIVHARSRAPAWSAFLAARRTGRPFVTTFHGIYSARSRLKRLYNSVMARGDRVIANSLLTAEHVRARYRVPGSRLVIIHRGLDPGRFDPAAVSQDRVLALRAAWGVDAGERVILLAGRLTRLKGHEVAIRAAALLKERGLGPFVLVMVGADDARGRHRPALEALALELGVKDRVRFPGHAEDMPAALLASDVVVSASTRPESFGRTVAEAGAMGRPVVATDLGAATEIVIPPDPARTDADIHTGWLVAADDPAALAAALAAALSLSPRARDALGVRARARVIANFTTARMTAATLAVYDALVPLSKTDSVRPEPTTLV